MSPRPRGLPPVELKRELEEHAQSLGLREPTITLGEPPAKKLADLSTLYPSPARTDDDEDDDDPDEDDDDDLLDEEDESEPTPKGKRRKRKSRQSSSYERPHTRLDGKRMVKTGVNLTDKARFELDPFFARLGPRKRNGWIERVLLRAARKTQKRWAKRDAERARAESEEPER